MKAILCAEKSTLHNAADYNDGIINLQTSSEVHFYDINLYTTYKYPRITTDLPNGEDGMNIAIDIGYNVRILCDEEYYRCFWFSVVESKRYSETDEAKDNEAQFAKSFHKI
jgi:hypothetical protein